ncbi:MAG: protein-export membrane protein SecD [SAR202 cluster bacterium Casp-Chloro-G4]|nr:protein translocase subunit SecD [Chloroflexota bacterium]PKB62155.1 MAG: protein-export membrane protein SecD [SAR202 cluster bacterium Casp-Chloro-G4]
MRRNAKSLIFVTILVAVALAALLFNPLKIGGFERGGDTLLGLSLGLDLQGGSHLVYEAQPVVDATTGEKQLVTEEDMASLLRLIEERVNASGLGEPSIQVLGSDRLLIQLPGVEDLARAKSLIGETARLEFKHRKVNVPQDLEADGIIVAEDIVNISAEPMPQEILDQIGNSSQPTPEPGVEPVEPVLPVAEDYPPVIIVEFTPEGAQKFAEVRASVGLTPPQLAGEVPPSALELSIEGGQSLKYQVIGPVVQRLGDSNRFIFPFPPDVGERVEGKPLDIASAQAIVGDQATVSFVRLQGSVDEDFGLSGDNLARAYPSLHSGSDQPIINIEFDEEGTKLFGLLTTEIAGSPTDFIAIFLDDRELIAPTVTQPITSGTAIIQGRDFTIERTRDIALQLEGGRLPVPILLVQERDVDAILGADSLADSVVAGAVGLALVFLFMTLYYRVPGVIASIALVTYSVLVFAVFKIMPVTLTLSGVAATILSIGMAVDANVLIFERMKDELRNGRTLNSAINIGFNRAWPAIRDSNVSTLITCGILFYFSNQLGTTIVQGFAAALAIGVLISMFSAIFVSRTILRVIASTGLSSHLRMFVPSGGSDLPQQRSGSPAVQRS